jgi:transcriptional regulator with XRE-family HTH domain
LFILPSHTLTRGRDRTGNAVDQLVGCAIRRQRLQRDMTRDQLTQAAEVAQPLIDDYEAGRKRPCAKHLLRIAKALGVAPAYFFDRPKVQ